MYRCKRRSSGGDETLRAAAPTKIRSISQFSSGYDVKPPRPPESGMLLYVIALPISPRGNRSYTRNDNDAALISPACTLCFEIPRDIRSNTRYLFFFSIFTKSLDLSGFPTAIFNGFIHDICDYHFAPKLCSYPNLFYVQICFIHLFQSIFLRVELYKCPQNCTGIA